MPQLGGYAGENPVTMGVDVASARNLNAAGSSEHIDSLYNQGHRKRALFIGPLLQRRHVPAGTA